MPDYPPIGITKLSELLIDIHKDWGAYRIENIGAPTVNTHVPRARAIDILSDRFGMARMPDGALGQYIRGSGSGVDPVYAIVKLSELSIDVAKDWGGYKISNLGAPTVTKDAFRLGDVITDAMHGSRGSGLHADSHAEVHGFTDSDVHTGLVIGDISTYRRTGRWYTSPITGTPLTTGAPSANVLRAIPFIVPKYIELDYMAINVTGAVAGKYRFGIYSDGGNLYPSSKIIEAGEVDTGTTGVKSISISLGISGNRLMWLVCLSNASPTIRCFAVASMLPILGFGDDLGTAPALGWSVSYTYGALPTTFPTGASLITAVPIPAIFVRVKP